MFLTWKMVLVVVFDWKVDNLYPVKNSGKATPVVNIQCMWYASDEIKKYKIAFFLTYDQKSFV